MLLTFPSLLGIDVEEAENPIQQILELKHQLDGNLVPFTSGRTSGFLFRPGDTDEVLILPNTKNVREGYRRVLIGSPDPAQASNDLSKGEWRRHPLLPARGAEPDYTQRISEVLDSWNSAFSFVEENPAQNVIGLRRPQIGAVHAAHTHWIVSDSAATIVMPTGTGKTETMLSILVSIRCQKLLVIVPTDALRTQLAEASLNYPAARS